MSDSSQNGSGWSRGSRPAHQIYTGRADVGERVVASAAEMRRHFGVVGESLRGDIRGLAELMAVSIERTDGRIGEQTGRSDSLEGRVLRREARVSILEGNRKARRPRRQL